MLAVPDMHVGGRQSWAARRVPAQASVAREAFSAGEEGTQGHIWNNGQGGNPVRVGERTRTLLFPRANTP